MKSSRSIQSSRVMRTWRVPAAGSSGLLTASSSSTRPASQSVSTSFSGLSTAIRRGAVRLSSSRTQCSSSANSTTLSCLVTPIRSQKSRIASGV